MLNVYWITFVTAVQEELIFFIETKRSKVDARNKNSTSATLQGKQSDREASMTRADRLSVVDMDHTHIDHDSQ